MKDERRTPNIERRTPNEDGRAWDLEERLLEFSVRVIRLAESLPLVKSPRLVEPLLRENDELIRIFVTSLKTAEARLAKRG